MSVDAVMTVTLHAKDLHALIAERDAALARLAAVEALCDAEDADPVMRGTLDIATIRAAVSSTAATGAAS